MAFLAFIGAIVAFCALAAIVSGCIYLALNLRAMAETPDIIGDDMKHNRGE